MNDTTRRTFIKGAALTGAALASAVVTSAAASSEKKQSPRVYSAADEGQYAGKSGSHAPVISIAGSKVTITTNHVMTPEHYISLHALSGAARYFGAYEFGIKDLGEGKVAVSTYDIGDYKGPLKAISVCNLHDIWMAEASA